MALDVQRCRADLKELQAQLEQWQTPDPPGLELWRHKLYALIGEILDPQDALAIRLTGLRWEPDSTSPRSRLDRNGLAGMAGPSEQAIFLKAKQSAAQSLRPCVGS